MADIVDKATRSRMMSAVRSKNTRPEMLLRKALHAAGLRYRLHVADLPGRPDLVFPKYRAVIFVHGCFWHGHEGCPDFRLPETRREFWRDKIQTNRQRDRNTSDSLQNIGWRYMVVWECQLRSAKAKAALPELVGQIEKWLNS